MLCRFSFRPIASIASSNITPGGLGQVCILFNRPPIQWRINRATQHFKIRNLKQLPGTCREEGTAHVESHE
jgi:hypothetical protein